jgi:hypothetical protein
MPGKRNEDKDERVKIGPEDSRPGASALPGLSWP